ncbi:MAG: hypothetical protein HDT12_00580 [Helicobacter sp.]|nr:hypothetical protein [Helicobacter sp.]
MKTSVLKKSLLDYAIKGHLSAKWRRANPTPNAFDEIESYNAQILKDKKSKEQELKELESNLKAEKDKETKQALKQKIQNLKKDIAKLKTIVPLTCHSERSEESQRDISAFSKPQYDNVDSCHSEFSSCHSDLECNEREESKRYFANAQYDKDAFIPPFVIPKTWAWVRLGDICEINPKNYINDELEISFVPMALIADNFQNRFTYESKKWKEVKSGFTHLCENSVAFAKITPCFENGKSFIVHNLKNGYGAGTTELIVLLPQNILLKEYLFYFVNCPLFVENAMKNFKGTAGQQRVSADFVTNFLIPLPPLNEQKQIVSILDSLIGLADSFDKTKEKLKRTEKRIEKSLLQHAILGKISSKWRRDISASPQYDKIPNAFDEIETYNAQILKDKKTKEQELKELESNLKIEKNKEAKQTLKQKIQNLKKNIAKLKTIVPLTCPLACHSEALAEESHIVGSDRDISLVSQAQYDKDAFIPPFAIPKTWAWVRLGDIVEIVSGTSYGKGDITNNNGIRILRGGNINKISNKLDYFTDDVILNKRLFNKEKSIVEGDIIITGTNDISNIAKSAFAYKTLKNTQIGAFLRIVRSKDKKFSKYIFYIFLSIFYEKYIQSCVSGTVSTLLNVKNEYLENFIIPLPPLSEQQEIVRTLDTLFALTKGLRVE